jgi:Ankyrin repeats (many copies)
MPDDDDEIPLFHHAWCGRRGGRDGGTRGHGPIPCRHTARGGRSHSGPTRATFFRSTTTPSGRAAPRRCPVPRASQRRFQCAPEDGTGDCPCTWRRIFRSSTWSRTCTTFGPIWWCTNGTIPGEPPCTWRCPDPIRIGGDTLQKVEFFLNVAPGMLCTADRDGRLPLHAAVDQESMLTYPEKTDELLSVVQLLIDRHPEALQQPDSSGNLALHAAANRYAPVPILRLLIEHFADALRVRNHQGLLPVHLALHRERSVALEAQIELCFSVSDCYTAHEVESVQLLVDEWPESIRELDSLGRSLVHCALGGPATPGHSVAWSLLQKWPDAVLARDHEGLLPLHVAAATDAPLELLYTMMQLQQKLVRERAKRRREQPMATTTTLATTTTTTTLALGPAYPKRPRIGDSLDS